MLNDGGSSEVTATMVAAAGMLGMAANLPAQPATLRGSEMSRSIAEDFKKAFAEMPEMTEEVIAQAMEGSTDSSDSETETEADGDDKLYSECLGEDIWETIMYSYIIMDIN